MSSFPNLRAIFASARTSEEERQISRQTFAKFIGFTVSCVVIGLVAHSKVAKHSLGSA
ncbi:hypothetical protein [Phaffia rhodozyma]|uniref:Uncharacterized protein n=1 Tax=Phaffia rhodozyma TaxID=264483 RepID=A0A0F7SEX6_PHARH|nr:hypothetical protein [Phaffia rhodozyma]